MLEKQKNFKIPVIGEVYMMKFEGEGNAQNGWRPGVVFQNNIGNVYSPNVIALPLTCAIKKINQPTHVILQANETGLARDSMVLCENPVTVSKSRMGRFLTKLPDHLMQKIAYASMIATAAISFLNDTDIMKVREIAIHMNE